MWPKGQEGAMWHEGQGQEVGPKGQARGANGVPGQGDMAQGPRAGGEAQQGMGVKGVCHDRNCRRKKGQSCE